MGFGIKYALKKFENQVRKAEGCPFEPEGERDRKIEIVLVRSTRLMARQLKPPKTKQNNQLNNQSNKPKSNRNQTDLYNLKSSTQSFKIFIMKNQPTSQRKKNKIILSLFQYPSHFRTVRQDLYSSPIVKLVKIQVSQFIVGPVIFCSNGTCRPPLARQSISGCLPTFRYHMGILRIGKS